MAGVTDLAFRTLCKSMGCGMTITEMISAKGLYYNDAKTAELLKIKSEEKPVSAQIFGSDPDIMAWAANWMNKQPHELLDINMGCPTPKIVKNGDGSALMKNPKLAGDVIRAVVKASEKPITVKIRAGWDANTINAVEMAKIAEESGAKAITVHGRTREQFYSGKADWSIIKEVKNAVHIPVIGNGDIFEASDAVDMINKTGCDGVMVARGARGNPWIFRDINSLLKNGHAARQLEKEEVKAVFIKHLSLAMAEKGEWVAIKEMRKHAAWYTKGFPGSARLRHKMNHAESAEEMISLIEYALN
ncbi:MAG: tRNA dihydrouridine synthase DusB [Tindallia sp. MSAO_Bac2]|nr:MAG: tRNA dihydrouridine synthase DusB [Tindallia sp. MSAO_Bac2]